MADIDVFGSLAEGAASGQRYAETLAQPEILKKAYAGASPEEVAKDPAKQQSIYAQAAAMAGQRGMNQLAYTFQKQASELNADAQKKQLDDLKIKENQATYANQLLYGAQNDQDLEDIVSKTVTDPAAVMQVKSILKNKDLDFPKKKEILLNMTETAQNRIAAMNSFINAQYKQKQIENIDHDNAASDKKDANTQTGRKFKEEEALKSDAKKRIDQAVATAQPPKYDDYVLYYGSDYAHDMLRNGYRLQGAPTQIPAKGAVTTPAATTKPTAETTGTYLERRANNIETKGSKDPYNEVNPLSGAVGKYQFVKSTWDNLRKIDPTLPTFDTLKGNKNAQEKAAKMLEASISDEIKNAGKPVTDANKDLWWRFGDTAARRLLAAKEDAKVSDVLSKDVIDKNPDLKGKTVAQAIAGNLSSGVPMEKVPLAETSVSKAQTGLPAERAVRTLEATMNVTKEMEAITTLPKGTVLGTFSGMNGQDQKGIIASLKSLATRNVTKDDQRAMEQYAAGIETSIATAVGGGYASAANEAKLKQLAKEIPREGDDGKAAARWMARVRQQLETVGESYRTNRAVNPDQKKQMAETMVELRNIIPFTVKDVNDALYSGKETMVSEASKTIGQKPSTSTKGVDKNNRWLQD
jgi:hypothetical protein